MPNVIVHKSNYARNVEGPTLTELVNQNRSDILFPIHRLDGKTTGVILFAKNKEVLSDFQELFLTRKVSKVYWAILRGFSPDKMEITYPIGPPKSEKQRMPAEKIKYKDAKTLLKTLAQIEVPYSIPPYDNSRYSLVEFSPTTGRTHQLRKHANHISHPIIGDHKYGDRNHNKFFANELKAEDLFLHAKHLEFLHPYLNKKIKITAEIPDSWEKLSIFKDLKSKLIND